MRPFRDLIVFWLLAVKNINIDSTYATFVLFQRVTQYDLQF